MKRLRVSNWVDLEMWCFVSSTIIGFKEDGVKFIFDSTVHGIQTLQLTPNSTFGHFVPNMLIVLTESLP